MNPSPYVSRFTMSFVDDNIYFSNCSDHYSVLQYDDLMLFFLKMSYKPHGPVHQLNGGVYGCDLLDPLVEGGYITGRNGACERWAYVLKENYRSGYMTPNTNCTVADNVQESYCGFNCTANSTEIYSNVESQLEGYLNVTIPDIEEVFYDFICDGGDGARIFPGDHLESASPSDPSFWVIHPTLERLLHAKLLSGGFKDMDWAENALSDFVCSKSICYDETTGELVTEGCCYGHYEYDQMYDANKADLSVTGLSNHDTQLMTDASSDSYAMSYIYDSFEWSHCVQDFNKLLTDMYVESLTTPNVTQDDLLTSSQQDDALIGLRNKK